MSLKNKIILVTGGAGYIGSHTVVELLQANADVIIIDNLSNSEITVIDRIAKITGKSPKILVGDIRNRGLVREVFANQKIDAVMHFAALKCLSESIEKPLEYYATNVEGTIVLIEEMIRAKVKKIIFSSSASVYGDPKTLPIKEDSQLDPNNPYAKSKAMVEKILIDLHRSNDLSNVAILRYFNPAGAHVSGLIGENPKDIPNSLMPLVLDVATGVRDKLVVYGNDYSSADGTAMRDYIHVQDLAEGHVAALVALKKTSKILILNLGTGKPSSVLEVIKACEVASGTKIDYQIGKRRPGDVPICYAHIDNAKKTIGWSATRDLDDMAATAMKFRVQLNAY